jgi:endo-1,4-beta-xylanase
MSFFKLFTAAAAFATAFAAPYAPLETFGAVEVGAPLERPTYDYLQSDDLTNVKFVSDKNSNKFQVDWSLLGNKGTTVQAGKGWTTGKARNVTYQGTYRATNLGYVGVYGWAKNPRVEYFVVESFTPGNPASDGQNLGTFKSDNGTYAIYRRTRYNVPGVPENIVIQYWSLRLNKRTEGTITLQNHFDAWRSKGLTLGTFDYQVFAVQATYGNGSATFTIGNA